MNQELQQSPNFHDIMLPDACLACGGHLAARLGPSSALGVCLACHAITTLALARMPDGVQVGQLPAGRA